jgi:hypothetical protein
VGQQNYNRGLVDLLPAGAGAANEFLIKVGFAEAQSSQSGL